MRHSRRQFVLAAGSFPWLVRAQEQSQDPAIFTSTVKVVNVFATVRAKNGAFVRDLTKDDFSLLENGRPQTIRYFSRETDLPLTLGLLIDTSDSQMKVLDAERSASLDFLDQVVREKQDQVFIMQFDLAVVMRQDLTGSHFTLENGLARVDTPSRHELSIQNGGGTLLYDAVVKAAGVMKNQTNRKALILLTDGVDTGSDATLTAAIEAAQRADTLIYSILFSDSGYYAFGGGADGRGVLMRLAKETGGSFFEVSRKQSLAQIYTQLQEELRSQYSLGFTSDQPVRVSEFRKLQLAAKPKNLVVQTRDRYWAQR